MPSSCGTASLPVHAGVHGSAATRGRPNGGVRSGDPSKGTSLSEPAEPVLPSIETTRFTAEQWKSRAMYEEACKLSMQRALARAIDVLNEALFAAASAPQQPVEDLTIDRRAWPLELDDVAATPQIERSTSARYEEVDTSEFPRLAP